MNHVTTTDRVTFGYTKTCAIILAGHLVLRAAIDPVHWGAAGGPLSIFLAALVMGLPIVVAIDLVKWLRWRRAIRAGPTTE